MFFHYEIINVNVTKVPNESRVVPSTASALCFPWFTFFLCSRKIDCFSRAYVTDTRQDQQGQKATLKTKRTKSRLFLRQPLLQLISLKMGSRNLTKFEQKSIMAVKTRTLHTCKLIGILWMPVRHSPTLLFCCQNILCLGVKPILSWFSIVSKTAYIAWTGHRRPVNRSRSETCCKDRVSCLSAPYPAES